MPKADRASQFMPFATLRSFYANIHNAERVVAPRVEMTDEDALRLSQIIASLRKGSIVRVTYYDTDAYVTMEGAIGEVVEPLRYLTVVKTKIGFDDICVIVPL